MNYSAILIFSIGARTRHLNIKRYGYRTLFNYQNETILFSTLPLTSKNVIDKNKIICSSDSVFLFFNVNLFCIRNGLFKNVLTRREIFTDVVRTLEKVPIGS